MREIKFRAWDTGAKKWETTPKIRLDGSIEEIDFDSEGVYRYTPEPSQYIIEQYTGLKDKNGKEIYEGDIIDFFGEKYPVIYRAGGFWAEYSKTQKDHLFLYAIDSEVIGNIHENPELLEDN